MYVALLEQVMILFIERKLWLENQMEFRRKMRMRRSLCRRVLWINRMQQSGVKNRLGKWLFWLFWLLLFVAADRRKLLQLSYLWIQIENGLLCYWLVELASLLMVLLMVRALDYFLRFYLFFPSQKNNIPNECCERPSGATVLLYVELGSHTREQQPKTVFSEVSEIETQRTSVRMYVQLETKKIFSTSTRTTHIFYKFFNYYYL